MGMLTCKRRTTATSGGSPSAEGYTMYRHAPAAPDRDDQLRLPRADEGARETVLDERRNLLHVQAALGQERARVLDVVHTPGLDFDVGESRVSQLRGVIPLFERA